MKLLLLLLCVGSMGFPQTGIGTTTPHESAVLDVESTTLGFLPPRMTEAEMNAIVTPAEGLMVYCANCIPKGLYFYDGSAYVSLMPAASATLNCGGLQS